MTSADEMSNGEGWVTRQLHDAYARMAATFESLGAIDGLEAGQRHVLERRVAGLLNGRERFLLEFRTTWSPAAVDAYRPLAGARGEEGLLDELMHLFGLTELTLVDGSETRAHLERTAAFARMLAEARGEPEAYRAALGHAALIHDVGLAVVPEELVASRGQVDSYEAQLVDLHTRIGALLVETVRDRLGLVDGPLAIGCDIVRCHHERFDGLGPQGLAGTSIPYPARLFAIADVYDTLRRARPHRDALDHAAAVVAVQAGNRDGRGQFDPELLPAFLACASEIGRQFELHADA